MYVRTWNASGIIGNGKVSHVQQNQQDPVLQLQLCKNRNTVS